MSRRVLENPQASAGNTKWNIHKSNCYTEQRALNQNDMFHSLLEKDALSLVLITSGFYAFLIGSFAVLYLSVDIYWGCAIDIYDPNNMYRSLLNSCYFSAETVLTIGYGVDDANFGTCASPLFLIFVQAMLSIMLDTTLFGVVFARITRAQPRAKSVAVSKVCTVHEIRGRLYLTFRVCELRSEQLVEAHIRVYTLRDDTDGDGTVYQCQPFNMRLQHPDDELGAMLLMNVPSFVVHRLDSWSPLCPPQPREDRTYRPSEKYAFPDVQQRDADVESGNREGEVKGQASSAAIRKYMEDTQAELIVLIEGIDPALSCTVQHRHSFSRDEIRWGQKFLPCVQRDPVGGGVTVDMQLFNQTMPCPGWSTRDDDAAAESLACQKDGTFGASQSVELDLM